jgi:phosphoribosylformylglycinamidine synthase PurS subunit
MDFKAEIIVSLKRSVFDPQGAAVKNSLATLGFDKVEKVRIGKAIEVYFASSDMNSAKQQVEEMCARLLVNDVIESYTYDISEDS